MFKFSFSIYDQVAQHDSCENVRWLSCTNISGFGQLIILNVYNMFGKKI